VLITWWLQVELEPVTVLVAAVVQVDFALL
jgi:hypothetical protein